MLPALVVLAALAVALGRSRWSFLLALAFALPVSTLGWDAAVAEVGGRQVDARLVVTFGTAGLAVVAIALDRPRLTRLELLVVAFGVWIVLVGLLRSDSVLTWAPPAARWAGVAAVLVLARACAERGHDVRALGVAVALGFAVPAALGVADLLLAEAQEANGARRATAPGGRGPLPLAFAGQALAVVALALALADPRSRRWTAATALGVGAVLATATRSVTATLALALAAVPALRRRWRLAVAAPLLVAVLAAAQPGLRERYAGTTVAEQPVPDGGGGDSSTRTRRAIWRVLAEEWREHPIAGMGPGMAAVAYERRTGVPRVAPHNDHLGALAETGVVGLGLLLSVQVAVLAGLWRRRGALAGTPAQALPVAVLVLFAVVAGPGALGNAGYVYDLQVPLFALVGAVLGASSVSATAPNLSMARVGSTGRGGGKPATSSS